MGGKRKIAYLAVLENGVSEALVSRNPIETLDAVEWCKREMKRINPKSEVAYLILLDDRRRPPSSFEILSIGDVCIFTEWALEHIQAIRRLSEPSPLEEWSKKNMLVEYLLWQMRLLIGKHIKKWA